MDGYLEIDISLAKDVAECLSDETLGKVFRFITESACSQVDCNDYDFDDEAFVLGAMMLSRKNRK